MLYVHVKAYLKKLLKVILYTLYRLIDHRTPPIFRSSAFNNKNVKRHGWSFVKLYIYKYILQKKKQVNLNKNICYFRLFRGIDKLIKKRGDI